MIKVTNKLMVQQFNREIKNIEKRQAQLMGIISEMDQDIKDIEERIEMLKEVTQ